MESIIIWVQETDQNTLDIMHIRDGKMTNVNNMNSAISFIRQYEETHPESSLGIAKTSSRRIE